MGKKDAKAQTSTQSVNIFKKLYVLESENDLQSLFVSTQANDQGDGNTSTDTNDSPEMNIEPGVPLVAQQTFQLQQVFGVCFVTCRSDSICSLSSRKSF